MKKILLLLLSIIFIARFVEAKIVKDSLYQIPKAKFAPLIDGLQDNIWKTIDWNMQRIYNVGDPPSFGGEADSGAGLTGMSKAMWDENNLYILFYSVDDVIIDMPANASWNQDAITFAIDGSNDHSTETSLKPGQFYFTIPHWLKGKEVGHLGTIFWNMDTTGIQFKISDVFDNQGFPGWMLELKIPLAALGIDAGLENQKIGWELEQDESDDATVGRQSMSKWWSSSNLSWANAGIWGTAILASRQIDTVLQILKTNQSITIDGYMDGAYLSANAITMNMFRVGDPPTAETADTDPMFGGFITAYPLWDANNLYIFYDVVDGIITDIPSNPGWNQDAVWLYVDGNNDHSQETSLKPGQNFLIIPHWLKGKEAGHLGYIRQTPLDTTGIEFKITDHAARGNAGSLTEEGSGYNVEIKIPLANLGIDGSTAGAKLGFELQLDNSNDAFSGRQGMEKWWNASNNSWANAGIWGYAELSDSIAVNPPTPNPPTLASPANGVTGIMLPPLLTWNASSGAASYRLQVSTDIAFTTIKYDESGITATSKTVNGLTNLTKYFWRANAKNASGTSGWSSIWSFTTSTLSLKLVSLNSVKDVPFDQGGKVELVWSASPLDTNINTLPYYSIWRALPQSTLKKTRIMNTAAGTFAWEWLANQPAHRDSLYSYIASTPFDSMSGTNGMEYFMVSAQTSDKNVFYNSNIDSGYSVDNLPPLSPRKLTASIVSGKVVLNWSPNGESDLMQYVVYRSDSSITDPNKITSFGMTSETMFTDEHPLLGKTAYYLIRAEDIHNNLSGASNQVSVIVTGVESQRSQIPANYDLAQNFPNPFNPTTSISYQLPINSQVILKVYDVLGREAVTLVNENQSAGYKSVMLNANQMPSGIYFYKLTAGSYTSIKKLVLLR